MVFLYYHSANFSEIYSAYIFSLLRKETLSYDFRYFLFSPPAVPTFPNSLILCLLLSTELTTINSPFE